MACDTPMTPLKPSYLKAPHQWAKGAKRRHCHMQQLRTPERLLQAPNIAANAVGERPRPARRGMRARAPAAGAGACASFMLPLACAPPSPLSASRLMSSSRSSAPSASCTENCAAGVCSDRFCACGRAWGSGQCGSARTGNPAVFHVHSGHGTGAESWSTAACKFGPNKKATDRVISFFPQYSKPGPLCTPVQPQEPHRGVSQFISTEA